MGNEKERSACSIIAYRPAGGGHQHDRDCQETSFSRGNDCGKQRRESPTPAEMIGVMAGGEGRRRSSSSMAAKCAATSAILEKGGKVETSVWRWESDDAKDA